MPNKNHYDTGDHSSNATVSDNSDVSDQVKAAALRDHHRRSELWKLPQPERFAAADAAKNILERDRLLKGHSTAQAAAATNMTKTQYEAIEAGSWPNLTPRDAAALKKYTHGLEPDVLLGPNDAEGRAKTAGRF
jgi:hypothetical protein